MGAVGHILSPAEILARLLTVDGAGSLLEADKVDGNDSIAMLGTFSARAAKTSTYTVVAGDLGKLIDCTSGTFSVALTAAATLGSGFSVSIYNSGAGTITVDPNASETIRDPSGTSTTVTLAQGEGVTLICDGSNWKITAQTSAASASGGIDWANPVALDDDTNLDSTAKNKVHVCGPNVSPTDYTVDIDTTTGWNVGDLIAFEITPDFADHLVTLTADGDIDGMDRIMWAEETCTLRWDGLTFRKIAGSSRPFDCNLINTASQSVASGTPTVLAFSMAGGAGYFIGDATTEKITVPRFGRYLIVYHAAITAGATPGTLRCAIYEDSTICASSIVPIAAGAQATVLAVFDGLLAAGEEITVQLSQASGNSVTVNEAPTFGMTPILSILEVPSW